MNRKAYGSDLSDVEWAILAPFIPPAQLGGRARATDMREVLDASFYILRGGCAWRLLPRRGVVERTFAWLGRYRRMSKDYEYSTESSKAFIYAAMVRLMLRSLSRTTTEPS